MDEVSRGQDQGPDEAFLKRLRAAPPSEVRRLLVDRTCALLARFLSLERGEQVGPREGFLQDLGFDSLMAVDFKILLEQQLGCALRSTVLFDCPTPESLVEFLLEALAAEGVLAPTAAATPTVAAGGERLATADLDDLDEAGLRALAARQAARLAALEPEPIAVVGLGCRLPGGSVDPAAYWRLLREGRDAIGPIPPDRWPVEQYYDGERGTPGKMYTRQGGFLGCVDTFDARFFGMAPKEAIQLDPQQRLLLEVAYEALEDGCQSVDELRGTDVGVFIGTCGSEYYDSQSGRAPETAESYLNTGNRSSTCAGRISYLLGFTGPNLALDTACSSSLVALHLACQSLLDGECSAALAGGVSIMLDPLTTVGVCQANMLSEDGRCHSFAEEAAGYGRSEGCGVVVLKRLSRARADGDRILALVRGSAINQDGASSGLTVPSGPAQEAVIRKALARARLAPGAVDYIEAHGTGTSLGDPIEMGALASVFGPGRPSERPLVVGTVKANIGHGEPVAGIGGFLKVVLSLVHEAIPANLHFEHPSSHIPWDEINVRVPTSPEPWPVAERERVAGVSSFGFSGTNAHVVVSEAPRERAAPAAPDRPTELLPLSAASDAALDELVGRWREHLAAGLDRGASLGDVCHAAAVGRAGLRHRRALVVTDRHDLLRQLGEPAGGADLVGTASTREPKIAFLFTGQGSQQAGMGQRLYAHAPVFRATIDRCNAILEPLLERPLTELLWGEHDDLLDLTEYTQPVMYAFGLALARLWESFGIRPAWVLGHSIGEFAAATVAGVLSLEDGCRLVAARGRLMRDETAPGAMLAVQAPADVVAPHLEGREARVALAALNGPTSVVLSGEPAAVAELATTLRAAGIASVPLAVSRAFHSPLMEPMLGAFAEVARSVSFGSADVGFVSCLDPGPVDDALATADYWVRHVREPVRFADGLAALAAQDCDVLLEIGPRATLLRMARAVLTSDTTALASRTGGADEWADLLRALGVLHVHGAPIDWHGVHAGQGRRKLSLPTVAFQRERYWLPEPPEPTARREAHLPPLLDRRVRTPGLPDGTRCFETRLAETTPAWVAEHRVFDAALLPGAAFLELALEAGATLHPGAPLALTDLAIHAPLSLGPGAKTLSVVLREQDDGSHDVRIASLSSDADGEAWSEHAAATVCAAAATRVDPVDLDAWRVECAEPVDLASYRAGFEELGLSYGPAFEGLVELHRGEGRALGRIVRPESLARDRGHCLHPALLDACFQTSAAALAGASADDTYLPVGVDGVTWHGPAGDGEVDELLCRASLHPPSADGRVLRLDLALATPGGRPLAAIAGLTLVRASAAALAGQHDVAPLLHTLSWPAVPHADDVPHADNVPIQTQGTWIVLGGAPTAALTEQLAARAVDARLLAPADDSGEALDATLETLRLVLEAGDVAGVVHALAWDADTQADGQAWRKQQRRIVDSARRLVQLLLSLGAKPPRLVFVTAGAVAAGPPARPLHLAGAPLWGFARSVALEHPELRCLCCDLDPASGGAPDLALDRLAQQILAPDGEGQVAWRAGERRVARLVGPPPRSTDMPSGPWRLRLSDDGVLDHLRAVPAERTPPGPGEVEVSVTAAALNFKEVLFGLGLLSPGGGGAPASTIPLGVEAAGIVSAVGEGVSERAVGERVLVWAPHGEGTLASHVAVPAADTTPVPAGFDLVAAAGLQTAYLTSAYGLQRLARLKAGERVLIHAAAGGVGQAAVRLALRLGAEVFATASRPKWPLLRALGVEHVMDSRSLAFAEEIARLTDGRGVDVVLNTLKGDVVPQSLAVLAEGGRFIELGKLEVWSAEQVAATRPDVGFHHFDLSAVSAEQPDVVRGLLSELASGWDDGSLGALPTTAYPVERTAEALGDLARARQAGKLVITTRRAPPPPALRPDAVYLVTGGLGALGLVVARWLVEHGARRLALLGRSAPSDDARAVLDELTSAGARLSVHAVDVTDRPALDELLAELRAEAPLAGVVHCAGVLRDAMVANLTWDDMQAVLAPKLAGAANLHAATAGDRLDLFVLFASMASLLGSPGQAAYAAGNAYLDALAHHRRALGLAATSFDWGPWSGGGMATDVAERNAARFAEMGLSALDPERGARVMTHVLGGGPAQVGVLPIRWSRYLARFPGGPPSLYAELATVAGAGAAAPDVLSELAGCADAAERAQRLLAFLRGQLAAVLGFGDTAGIDDGLPFVDMGVDSLLAVDLRNRIEASLGQSLPATLLFDQPTLQELCAHLLTTVVGEDGLGAIDDELLAEVEGLSDEEVERLLAAGDGDEDV